jgi:DNA-binding transcriptional MocR family regulator
MALEGIHAHPDDITITAGSQQGLDLVTRIFCNPGDVILAESPSYVGALGTFLSYEAEVVHVPSDEDGIDPVALRETAARLRAEGKRVKFLYTIPNYNNPSGVTQPWERRLEVLAACEAEGVIVVEDNPYGLLSLDADPVPAMRSVEENVIYLGSFSKTFAPGFRVGWVLAPHAVREKLVLAQESATLCPPVFSQFAIANYLANHDWKGQVTVFKDMYRERRDAMLRALADEMPAGTTWTHPAGGFFVWVTLPEGLDSQAMLPRGVNARVAFVPGPAFYADGQGARNVRLSFCFPPPDRIEVGVRRFADVVRRELEVMNTFGVHHSPTLHDNRPGPSANLA